MQNRLTQEWRLRNLTGAVSRSALPTCSTKLQKLILYFNYNRKVDIHIFNNNSHYRIIYWY